MQIRRYRSPDRFLDRAKAFLFQAEAENGLFLGISGPRELPEHCYLATIEHKGEVVACAACTPPYGVNITRAPLSALEILIEDLAKNYAGRLPSVRGPEPTVSEFARHWSARAGTRTRPIMRMRLFEARSVRPLEAPVQGMMRTATEHDLPIVEEWGIAFDKEAGTGNPVDPARATREQVAEHRLFLWDHGGPVSMAASGVSIAASAGRVGRSVSINVVYTPREYRQQGYASACVQTLTQQFLSGGVAFCCINADVSNPTTNKIYPAIGYRPVCELSNIDLNAG